MSCGHVDSGVLLLPSLRYVDIEIILVIAGIWRNVIDVWSRYRDRRRRHPWPSGASEIFDTCLDFSNATR